MPISGLPTTEGDDIVTVTPGSFHSVNGLAGQDTLVVQYGSLDTDVIYRNMGYGWYRYTDDFHSTMDFYSFERFDITTGSGDDYVVGGGLNDRFVTGAGNDTIWSGLGADTIDGGAGFDHWIGNYETLNVNVSAILNPAQFVTVLGTGARVRGIEQVDLTTGAGADVLDVRATNGNHRFYSNAGDDTFRVAGGRSTYQASDGVDLLHADFSSATTRVGMTNLGYGWWRIGDAANTMSVEFYGVERVEYFGGIGNDTLSGGELNDLLSGGAGDDWLNGYRGFDTLNGGEGTDTWEADYSPSNTAVRVNLNTQVVNVGSITGIEAMRMTSGSGNDVLTAHAGRYNDTLKGGDGADTISTGLGRDNIEGGLGTDTLIMDWSALSDPAHGIVYSNQGYGWQRFAGRSGDQLDYYGMERFNLVGGAGHDHLVGGGDRDTLIGNAGDDTLNSGEGLAVIDGGEGDDLWAANLTAINVGLTMSAAASQNTAQLTGRGFSVRNIERVSLDLGAGNDSISTAGFGLTDVINSGGGNDTLNTGLGQDTVNGGGGVDVLVMNYASQSSDFVATNLGYGWYRYGTQDGSSYVEFYGMERYNLTGGSGNDYLWGSALADTLAGGAGNDTLIGGSGKDVIRGGSGHDVWNMDMNAATVALKLTLTAAGDGTLLNNGTTVTGIESVQLITGAGNDAINLSAVVGNHTLETNGGDDVVNLGRGQQNTVNGGTGTDTLAFDGSLATSGLRTNNEGYGWWNVSANDGSYKTRFYGFEQLDMTGSNFNDRLYGQDGNDVIRGGVGRDILNGFVGNDTLHGGAGADFFEFSSLWSNGVDLVADAATGDFLRFNGARINSLEAGDGSTVLQWEAELQTVNGVTSLYLGLDGTAGYDFRVDLTGAFGADNFSVVSYSDFTGGADLIVL